MKSFYSLLHVCLYTILTHIKMRYRCYVSKSHDNNFSCVHILCDKRIPHFLLKFDIFCIKHIFNLDFITVVYVNIKLGFFLLYKPEIAVLPMVVLRKEFPGTRRTSFPCNLWLSFHVTGPLPHQQPVPS